MEEIQIKVPWGHVAGKWWGPKNVRPILAVHGWQDNAGTFDRLIPELPNHLSYLAIDLPGHGISSHYPEGMSYNINDSIYMIGRIQRYFGWDKLSLMGHSIGCQINFVYSVLYSDVVDMIISLDILRPMTRSTIGTINNMRFRFDKLALDEKRRRLNSPPPTYTKQELIDLFVKGSNHSITEETVHHLLDRGMKEYTAEPGRYYVARDSRIKYYNVTNYYHQLLMDMIPLLKAPFLFIKFTDSAYFEEKRLHDLAIEALEKSNIYFENHYVDGKHHAHLTNPKIMSGHISRFIQKFRPDN